MTSFDKDLWAGLVEFRPLNNYPTLPCPYCRQRSLSVEQESLAFRGQSWSSENKAIQRSVAAEQRGVVKAFRENKFLGALLGVGVALNRLSFEPAIFTGFLSCGSCEGDVAMTGSALRPVTGSTQPLGIMVKAEYFSPPVPMFEIPATTPAPVAQEVIHSFQHFHCDLTASGAKIRRALERVCESLGYGGRTLHKSIEAMAAEYPVEAKWLGALKMVGNEATHSDQIEEADLLASFKVLEAVLGIFQRKALEADVAKEIPAIQEKFSRSPTTNFQK
jgi:hypothetical protein